jgi:hypothetical protein
MAGGMVMGIERAPGGSSLIDVLDRVLDKGAHFGHRDHSDRSIVISEIGGS